MGKKKKDKKTRKYSQKQFVEIFCPSCSACPHEDYKKGAFRPVFCYKELYAHEQKEFLEGPYLRLKGMHTHVLSTGKTMRSLTIEQFRNVVCDTGICYEGHEQLGHSCGDIEICYRLFREQMGIHAPGTVLHSADFSRKPAKTKYVSVKKGKKKKKAKVKYRYVAEAYPTFFVREDNPAFKETIENILHGNNYIEQNNSEESAGSNSGSAADVSEDTKS